MAVKKLLLNNAATFQKAGIWHPGFFVPPPNGAFIESAIDADQFSVSTTPF
jgi:hypothetical protein